MNKYQKEKSREIRDIMRTDLFGRMTYKEAKRKWRNGIRAFRVGNPKMNTWIVKDLAHLGFSRSKLMELSRAYHKVLKYCAERNLGFTCSYDPYFDHYDLRFNGWSVDRKKYTVMHSVTGACIRQCRGSLMDIAELVLEKVNRQLQEFVFPSVIKAPVEIESLYPKLVLHDWKIQNPEAVFGKIIAQRVENLGGNHES